MTRVKGMSFPPSEDRTDVADLGELVALSNEIITRENSLSQMVRDMEGLRCPATGERADQCARCVAGEAQHFPGGLKRSFLRLFEELRGIIQRARLLVGTTIAARERKAG